jgi:hypothetical protein
MPKIHCLLCSGKCAAGFGSGVPWALFFPEGHERSRDSGPGEIRPDKKKSLDLSSVGAYFFACPEAAFRIVGIGSDLLSQDRNLFGRSQRLMGR